MLKAIRALSDPKLVDADKSPRSLVVAMGHKVTCVVVIDNGSVSKSLSM